MAWLAEMGGASWAGLSHVFGPQHIYLQTSTLIESLIETISDVRWDDGQIGTVREDDEGFWGSGGDVHGVYNEKGTLMGEGLYLQQQQ